MHLKSLAAACAALLVLVAAAPSPAPSPMGFAGQGTGVITFVTSAATITVDSQIALAARGTLYRLDLVQFHVQSRAAGSEASPMPFPVALDLLPKTVLFNAATRTVTIVSSATRRYFVTTVGGPSPKPSHSPSPTPKPSASARTFGTWLKDLKAMSMSITFAGHGTTNDHPTSEFDYQSHWEYEGKPGADLTATAFLAEDIDGLPVRLHVSGKSDAASAPTGSLDFDVTSVQRVAPAASRFTVPAGYTRVGTFFDLFRKGSPANAS